jgi:hypothetical protein
MVNNTNHFVTQQRLNWDFNIFLEQGNFKGFSDTFEDLHGMLQLPGIGAQRMMAKGYGFAGEGDWKTAALVRAMKVMGTGLKGGNSLWKIIPIILILKIHWCWVAICWKYAQVLPITLHLVKFILWDWW